MDSFPGGYIYLVEVEGVPNGLISMSYICEKMSNLTHILLG